MRRIRELEKRLRQSKQALLGTLAFAAIVLLTLMVAQVFSEVPWWAYVLFLWVVPFGLIGDGINIIHICRRLKTLRSGIGPASSPDG